MRMTKEKLRDIVTDEAFAFQSPIRQNLERCDWRYDPQYPVSTFTTAWIRGFEYGWTKKDFRFWYQGEKRAHRYERPGYFKQLEEAWLSFPESVGPVIIAELSDDSIDVGDGWHRIAMSVLAGKRTLPAIVGRCEI